MRNRFCPRRYCYSFKLHEAEKEELEKFLKAHPQFHNSYSYLFRVALFEYIYAVQEAEEHITKECMRLIGG